MKHERFRSKMGRIALAATIASMPGAATAEYSTPFHAAESAIPDKGAIPEQEVFHFKQQERKNPPKKLPKLR
jgi:hypothetical protein